jgi:hypothetical protein
LLGEVYSGAILRHGVEEDRISAERIRSQQPFESDVIYIAYLYVHYSCLLKIVLLFFKRTGAL